MTTSESPQISSLSTSCSSAIFRPMISAWYSASLFVTSVPRYSLRVSICRGAEIHPLCTTAQTTSALSEFGRNASNIHLGRTWKSRSRHLRHKRTTQGNLTYIVNCPEPLTKGSKVKQVHEPPQWLKSIRAACRRHQFVLKASNHLAFVLQVAEADWWCRSGIFRSLHQLLALRLTANRHARRCFPTLPRACSYHVMVWVEQHCPCSSASWIASTCSIKLQGVPSRLAGEESIPSDSNQ